MSKTTDRSALGDSRRKFLKKATYSAPALISLGLFSGPLTAADKKGMPIDTEDTCPTFPNCTDPSAPYTFREDDESILESKKKGWA